MALRRQISAAAALAYVPVQVAGCLAGATLAHIMFELPVIQISHHERGGLALMTSEGAATFALVFAILSVSHWRPQAVPAAVALVITAGYWWTSSTSFANPAITIARAMTDTFAGIRPADVPGFIAAQIIGALAALGAAHLMLPKEAPE
jgi:glycerol uptake facilitator-like aquaporin